MLCEVGHLPHPILRCEIFIGARLCGKTVTNLWVTDFPKSTLNT